MLTLYHSQIPNAMIVVQNKVWPIVSLGYALYMNYREVKALLYPSEPPYNHPCISCQVYHMTQQELLENIVKSQILGKCDGNVHVDEYQKEKHFILICLSEKEN